MDNILERTCIRSCDRISYFNRKCSVDSLIGLTLLSEWLPHVVGLPESPVPKNHESVTHAPYTSSMEKFDCISCGVSCSTSAEMKVHFKSKMHVATISRLIPRDTRKTYQDVDNFLDDDSDESSDSGSESSNEADDTVEPQKLSPDVQPLSEKVHCKDALGRPMIFFRNRKQEIVGIYRCLLYSKQTLPSSVDQLLQRVNLLRQSRYWAILLYSGGRFSGGIFDEEKELIHKTLHRYTVRAKQGGSQASRDGASGGLGGPNSAGASLRRYGEQAIRADIANLLHVKWRPYLQACQFILTWSPKVHRAIFYTAPQSSTASFTASNPNEDGEGDHAPDGSPSTLPPPPAVDALAGEAVAAKMGVVANDPRLRRLPCRANKVTYAHVKELHRTLSLFQVFEDYADPDLIRMSGKKQLSTLLENGDDTVFESRSGRLFIGSPCSLGLTSSSAAIEKRQSVDVTKEAPCTSSSSSSSLSRDSPEPDSVESAPRVGGSPDGPKPADDVSSVGNVSRRKKTKRKRQKRRRQHRGQSNQIESDDDGASGGGAVVRREMSAEEWLTLPSPSQHPAATASSASDLAALCSTYSVWHRALRMATAMGNIERLAELLPLPSDPDNATTTSQPTMAANSTATIAPIKSGRAKASITPTTSSSNIPEPWPEDESTVNQLLNYRLTDGRSLLHLAVELQSDPEVISILLAAGCRPDGKDSGGLTPYRLAGQLGKKRLLLAFKSFRASNPDKYDYEKAQIPVKEAPPRTSGPVKSPSGRRLQQTKQPAEKLPALTDRLSIREKNVQSVCQRHHREAALLLRRLQVLLNRLPSRPSSWADETGPMSISPPPPRGGLI